MPTIYSLCDNSDPSVETLAKQLIGKYHPDLAEADVLIEYAFAEAERDGNNDPIGPGIMVRGYPKSGYCKLLSTIERALGRPDVRIMLDKDVWAKMPADQRAALLDHELYHIIVCREADGDIKTDEYNRPKLKARLHDHEFGWFDKIAARHGKASIEVQNATHFANEHGGTYFQTDMFAAQP